MALKIRLLEPGDAAVLGHVAPEVFDADIHPRWSSEFLADPRHHLAVAIDGGTVVGMATAVHCVNPDKPPQLWVREVSVAPAHRRRGIGLALCARSSNAAARSAAATPGWAPPRPTRRRARSIARRAARRRRWST